MWVEMNDPVLRDLVLHTHRYLGEAVHPEFAEDHLILCKKSNLTVTRTIAQINAETLGRRAREETDNGAAAGRTRSQRPRRDRV